MAKASGGGAQRSESDPMYWVEIQFVLQYRFTDLPQGRASQWYDTTASYPDIPEAATALLRRRREDGANPEWRVVQKTIHCEVLTQQRSQDEGMAQTGGSQ